MDRSLCLSLPGDLGGGFCLDPGSCTRGHTPANSLPIMCQGADRVLHRGWLCQHAEPDLMPLVASLKGDTGTVAIGGAKAVGTPVEGRETLKSAEEDIQIQRKSWQDYRCLLCPSNEFHGRGVHD